MAGLLVLDDDRTYGDYIGEVCSQGLGISVEVEDSPQRAYKLLTSVPTQLLLCDVRMPEMSGIEFVQLVSELECPPKIVGMTSFDEDINVIEMLRAGALGMVLKAGPESHILQALQEARSGRGYISSLVAQRINRYLMPVVGHRRERALSQREQDVLRLVIQGYSNVEIAKKLHISLGTVKKHLVSLFQVFNVDSRVRLVVAAMQTQ